MKKLLFGLFVSLLVVSSASASWVTGGVVVNPAANAILADSGPVVDTASHEWDLYISSTVATAVVIEWRDATNTANVFSHIIPIPANGTVFFSSRGSLEMQSGQRIRVRQNSAATGSIQCSINFF